MFIVNDINLNYQINEEIYNLFKQEFNNGDINDEKNETEKKQKVQIASNLIMLKEMNTMLELQSKLNLHVKCIYYI